jgi:hypothetical protein
VTITKAIKKLRKAGKIYKEGRSYIFAEDCRIARLKRSIRKKINVL